MPTLIYFVFGVSTEIYREISGVIGEEAGFFMKHQCLFIKSILVFMPVYATVISFKYLF